MGRWHNHLAGVLASPPAPLRSCLQGAPNRHSGHDVQVGMIDLHKNSQGYLLLYLSYFISICQYPLACINEVILFQKTYKCT